LEYYGLTEEEVAKYIVELSFGIGMLPSGYERSNGRVWDIIFTPDEMMSKYFAYQVDLSATDGRIYNIFKDDGARYTARQNCIIELKAQYKRRCMFWKFNHG